MVSVVGDCCVLKETTGLDTDDSATIADYQWDTEVHRDARSFSLDSDTGIQCRSRGPHLVVYNQSHSATGSNRSELTSEIRVDGTVQNYGKSTHYIRRDGTDQGAASCAMTILDLDDVDQVISIGHRRTDSNTAGATCTRTAGDNGFAVVKLNDRWDYFLGRGTSSQTISTLGVASFPMGPTSYVYTDINFDVEDRKDGAYTHDTVTNSDEITLEGGSNYLICYHVEWDNTGSTRQTGVTRLRIDGIQIPGSYSTSYARASNGCDTPISSGAVLYTARTPGDDEILTLQAAVDCESAASMDVIAASITIVKLGVSTQREFFGAYNSLDFTKNQAPGTHDGIVWSGGGLLTGDGSEFSVDGTNPERINFASASSGRYLVWAGFFTSRSASDATRKRPQVSFRYNDGSSDTDLDYGVGDEFNRGDQSTTGNWGAGGLAGGVFDLTTPAYVEASGNDPTSTAAASHVWEAFTCGIFVIDLASLAEADHPYLHSLSSRRKRRALTSR